MKVEHVQLLYNQMDEVKIVKFLKIHYPIFTFLFNWIVLNGQCILRLSFSEVQKNSKVVNA